LACPVTSAHLHTMYDSRVRPAQIDDAREWTALRIELWPESPLDHAPEVAAFLADPPASAACFVAEDRHGRLVGFVEAGLRSYAEECTTSPVGYIEGIFVLPSLRRAGVGRALVEAAESWARSRGCSEMASDRALANEASGGFHVAVGFEEVNRIVCYRKDL
jgi:aminoglycoside 6'-N-acetyltransferase I